MTRRPSQVTVPGRPVSALDRARQRARHEHARLVLGNVLAVCHDAGIGVLPVKGVITARRFYGDPSERPIQDVDLRVRPADLSRILEAGTRAGWPLLSRSRAYGTLGFDVSGFLVEFESHVGPPGLCALSVASMLQRALPRSDLFGRPHLEPEVHDHALVLCVNAFKDKLIDAVSGAIRDLELIPQQPAFEPRRFVALASATGATTLVSIVATWLAETRGARSWGQIRDMAGLLPPRPLYARLFGRAIGASRPSRPVLRLLARLGADRRSHRAMALGTMALELVTALASRRHRVANVSPVPGIQPVRTQP